MKKLITLLTLLVLCVTGVWAEDETIFSAVPTAAWKVTASTTDAEITSTYATITGGKMYLTNQQTSDKEMIKSQGGEFAFQHTNNNTFFKVVLDKELEAGDIISARIQSRTDADLGLWFSTATSRPSEPATKIVLPQAGSQAWVAAPTYTVEAGDGICGETTFYIYRHTGKSTYFNTFTITRPVADTRTPVTLTFASASANANLGESFSAPVLTIDPAAASGEVAYTSSNTNVATVIPSTGAIALVSAGKTTITAAISGSATYKDASASYELTVADPNAINVSTTWTMADGAESVGVAGADETVMKTDWSMGSNISIHPTPTATYGGTTVTQFIPAETIGNTERVASNCVEFSMTPWKGLIFTPTAVSFEAFRVGTNGPTIDVDFIDGEGNTIKLETNAAITRNNKVGEDGQANQVHNHTLTTAVASTKAVKLRIYIRNCAADKNVAFGNIVISGTASGEAVALTSYTVTTSVNIAEAGTISPLLGANSVYETNDLRLTASANEGYEFVNWTIDGEAQTGNPYTIKDITDNHTAVANFKQLLVVTFAAGEGTGVVPANIYGDEGETVKVPKSYFLAKSGYTLTGWTDGANTYKAGDTFAMPAGGVTLTAVFEENAEALSFTLASTTVTWDFQQKSIGEFTSATSGTFVAQATVNEKTIDVPMTFDKQIPNASWTDWANLGNKPTLTIPAVKGMQITLLTYTSPSTSTIAGATNYDVTGENAPYTVKYTYTGSAETVDIALTDGSYIRTVSVDYPKTHTYVDVTDAGYRTFASSSALDFTEPITGLKAYKATATGSTITFEAINCAVPAETGMLLKAAEGRYYIPLASGDPAGLSDNKLVGTTTKKENVEAGIYVLMNGDKGVGFYKTTAAFTVGANTAYLPANVAAGRTFIGFEEESETTGVKAIERVQATDNFFNLNGQRVAAPQKGIYIMNGKKVIKK